MFLTFFKILLISLSLADITTACIFYSFGEICEIDKSTILSLSAASGICPSVTAQFFRVKSLH